MRLQQDSSFARMSEADRQSLIVGQSGSPYAHAVKLTLSARLDDLRNLYEGSPASEYTRGRVNELQTILELLSTGDSR
jgi:hypothetical protein